MVLLQRSVPIVFGTSKQLLRCSKSIIKSSNSRYYCNIYNYYYYYNTTTTSYCSCTGTKRNNYYSTFNIANLQRTYYYKPNCFLLSLQQLSSSSSSSALTQQRYRSSSSSSSSTAQEKQDTQPIVDKNPLDADADLPDIDASSTDQGNNSSNIDSNEDDKVSSSSKEMTTPNDDIDNNNNNKTTTKNNTKKKKQNELILDPLQFTCEIPVRMPNLETGSNKVLRWYKQEGDIIKYGDKLCDIETRDFTFGMEIDDEEIGIMGKIMVPAPSHPINPDEIICVLLHKSSDDDKNTTGSNSS